MKRKVLMIVISLLLVLGVYRLSMESDVRYVFANIVYGTNGMHNGNMIFSKESGFYDDEFELKIYAPTNEIYYTIDGSDPDRTSIKYEGAISVQDASKNPNVYSMRTDVTTEFLHEELEKYSKEKYRTYYQTPDYLIDKCNVIKAVYYDKAGNCSEIEERVYFVDFDEKSGYENINVISITTDPDNLFGYENGIYVTGRTYDVFRAETDLEEFWAAPYWEHWSANYKNKGIDWERIANIQVFDEGKNLVLSQNAGIRTQGGGSRGFLPKSLNIYAREEYGSDKMYYDFFNTGYYPKRVTLTTGGDDYYTKIKDKLVSELSSETSASTMHYEPYALFLNGEYWGFYYLTEKYDTQYVEEYFGVDKGGESENIIIVKNGLLEKGLEGDLEQYYTAIMEDIYSSNLGKNDEYERICGLIDINSCIDYFAVLGYAARCGDWPDSNFAMWRSRNISDKPYEDGKWRWMVFDVNSTALGSSLISHDIIVALRNSSRLFDKLCDNENFRRAFAERLIEMSDTIFEKDHVSETITEYIELMDEPMEKHYRRFFGTSNERFHEGTEEIREFYNQRKPYIIESIRNNFGEEYLGEKQ